MKKRTVTAIAFLLLSFLLTFISLNATKNIAAEISGSAEKINQLILYRPDNAETEYSLLSEKWQADYKILSTYISHQHLENIEHSISALESYIKLGDYTSAQIICAEISASIKHLYRSELPLIQNIF